MFSIYVHNFPAGYVEKLVFHLRSRKMEAGLKTSLMVRQVVALNKKEYVFAEFYLTAEPTPSPCSWRQFSS